MSELVRFSVSLEAELLERFDRYCTDGQFANRSEAIRQLLHRALIDEAWTGVDGEAVATLTMVYDHHRPGLVQELMDAQHDRPCLVNSTLHVHLTQSLCLEVIVLRGPAEKLRAMAARLGGLKGVRCSDLSVAHAPGDIPSHHHHRGMAQGRPRSDAE